MKVVPLFAEQPAPAETGIPNQAVIEGLRECLAKAESGEIQGYAIAYALSDGCVSTSLEANGNNFAMSHAIGALWFRFQNWMAENAKVT